MEAISYNGKILNLTTPVVMGILNVTPDSFYEKSRVVDIKDAVSKTASMIDEGAQIVDIGGMSSRPGSEFITLEEELLRVIPVVKAVRKAFPDIFISVDTFRMEVAKQAEEEGTDIVNDISAGSLDPGLPEFVAEKKLPYIFMHMLGKPKTMQEKPVYDDVVSDILKFMINKIRYFRSIGIEQIIADPGFGFGKNIEDNFRILNNLEVFRIAEVPLLTGISRKSMLYRFLEITPEESLNATTAMHVIALQKSAKILRVHDVKEAVEVVRLMKKLKV
jgi:dihydropteroate synthase